MLLKKALLCFAFAVAWAQECPNAEDILPCVCSINVASRELSLDCSRIVDVMELQTVLQASFPTKSFKEFTMRGKAHSPVPVTYLPDGLFGDLSFQSMFIEHTDLVRIGDNLLESSYEIMEVLRITNSKLTSFPTIAFQNFSSLSFLDISHNELAYIQDLHSSTLNIVYLEANKGVRFSKRLFSHAPQLVQMSLARCGLKEVDKELFSKNGHLQTVYLQSNDIAFLETGSLTFANNSMERIILSNNAIADAAVDFLSGTSGKETLNLINNQLTLLREEVWLPIFTRYSTQGGLVVLDENPLKCDCSLAWLVSSPGLMESLGVGATCEDGARIHSLDPDEFKDC